MDQSVEETRIMLGNVILVLKDDPTVMDTIGLGLGGVAYFTVKILEQLLDHSKELILWMFRNLFARYDISVEYVERGSVKVFLTVDTVKKVQHLLLKIKDQLLHKEICSAIEEASLIEKMNQTASLDPKHLMISLQTTDGVTLNELNFQMYFPSRENRGMTIYGDKNNN